jgi:hypothetical protein
MENEKSKGDLEFLHALLLVLAMFGVNCIVLGQITDSFQEVTKTGAACVMMTFIIWLFTVGMIEGRQNYTIKTHFVVINIVLLLVSLKIKYSIW